MRARRLAAMAVVALLAVWGVLVLLRTDGAPADERASIAAPVRVEALAAELPTPRLPEPESRPEPSAPIAAESPANPLPELLPADGLHPIDTGAAALEVAILLPDGSAADSRFWNVWLRAETPPFEGGSNLRRILMLDTARPVYVVSDLLPGLATWIEVDDEQRRSLLQSLIPGLPAGQGRSVELRLREFPTQLEVLVTDESGSPLPGASVAIGPVEPFDPSQRWVRTDDQGRLSRCVSGLDDTIALRVRHTGYASRTMLRVPVKGGSVTLRVALEPERVVRVFLCDGHGVPLDADSVSARIGNQSVDGLSLRNGRAGPGWWELRELPEGTVTVVAELFGTTFTRLHDTEKPEARLELTECGTLVVYWDPASQREGEDPRVVVRPDTGPLSSGRVLDGPPSARGARTIALPAGSYEVGLLGPRSDAIVGRAYAEIRAGQVTELTLSP